jgi:hypothetical protein
VIHPHAKVEGPAAAKPTISFQNSALPEYGNRPGSCPDDLYDLLDREGEAERKQEFRDMTVTVNPSQAKSLPPATNSLG